MTTMEQAIGIDVSHYKKQIDWIQVKQSGVQFAIIKATEADNFVDPRFDYNWSRTRKQGMIRGAYHFFRPLVDPVRQANNFIKIAGRTLHRTDLPPVLDVESYPDFVGREWKQISLDERLRRIQIWLQTVEAATGRVPIIYTEYYAWRDFIGNTEKFVRHPLWIANYRVETPKVPANNWGGHGWTLWQTTEKGVVPGIRDEAPCVDLDVFRGAYKDLQDWLKIDQPRALPPEVTNGDMMAAMVDTADLLGISSEDFVSRANLRYLVDPIGNSLRPYDGPAVEDLAISEKEKRKLSKLLGKFIGTNSAAWCITHQDLINAFYSVASQNGSGGWTLVEKAGLNYIGENRAALYDGPVIEKLPGLTQDQKAALAEALGLAYRQEVDETEVIDIVEEESEQPVDMVEEEPAVETPLGQQETQEVEQITQEQQAVSVDENEAQPPQQTTVFNTNTPYGNQLDNQAMINAFYLAAIKLDLNGRELLSAAGLSDILENRMDIYSGPRLEKLPGLTSIQRKTIAELLGIQLDESLLPVEVEVIEVEPISPVEEQVMSVSGVTGSPEDQQGFPSPGDAVGFGNEVEVVVGQPTPVVNPVITPTYPGLVNQDLINLFYKVAALFGENGWHWIVRCGLGAIGASRKTRFEDYRGPYIKSIPGLTKDQVDLLEREINQLKYA